MSYTAAVITVSDLGSQGKRIDTSGPAVCAMLEGAGFSVVHTAIVPDEQEKIREALIDCADERHIGLIVTTGGTGLSPRDVTPEATLSVLDREIRAIPVAMWVEGLKITPRAMLSRAVAGTRGSSLMSGELSPNDETGGTMKHLTFYVCPACGNILTAALGAACPALKRRQRKTFPRSSARWSTQCI